MPLDLKASYDKNKHIAAAARNRVLNDTDLLLSESDIEIQVSNFLERQFPLREQELLRAVPFSSGQVLTSQAYNRVLKDKAFLSESLVRIAKDLGDRVARDSFAVDKLLTSITDGLSEIGSEVIGDYVALVKHDLTKGKGFKSLFGGNNFFDYQYLDFQDPRTGRKFLGTEYIETKILPGAILPIADYEIAQIKSIDIDLRSSGVSAFDSTLSITNPMDMVTPGKVFVASYFIPHVSEEVDLTVLPFLSIVCELSCLTKINYIAVTDFADDQFFPTLIEVFVDGDWVSLESVIDTRTQLEVERYLFAEQTTDRIRLTFTSFSFPTESVTNTSTVANLNNILVQNNWGSLFPEDGEEKSGKFISWYIKDLEFGYFNTAHRGYGVSLPLTFSGYLRKLFVDGQAFRQVASEEEEVVEETGDFLWQEDPSMANSSFAVDGRLWIAGNDNSDIGRVVWDTPYRDNKYWFELEYNASDGLLGSPVDEAEIRLGFTNEGQNSQDYDIDMTDESWGYGIMADTGEWRTNGVATAKTNSGPLVSGDRLVFAVDHTEHQVWVGLVGAGPGYAITWFGSGSPDPETSTDPTATFTGDEFRPAASDADVLAVGKVTLHGSVTGVTDPPEGWTWLDTQPEPEAASPSEMLTELGLEIWLSIEAYSSESQKVIEEIIPVAAFNDLSARYSEMCVLVGDVSKMRFFPQLNIMETTFLPNTPGTDHSSVLPLVYSDKRQLLTIGTDYEVSVDGGLTWLTAWPSEDYYGVTTYAGMAALRFLGIQEDESFFTIYYLASRQWLSSSKNFYLQGHKIFSSENIRNQELTGRIQCIPILRTRPANLGPVGFSSLFFGAKYAESFTKA